MAQLFMGLPSKEVDVSFFFVFDNTCSAVPSLLFESPLHADGTSDLTLTSWLCGGDSDGRNGGARAFLTDRVLGVNTAWLW